VTLSLRVAPLNEPPAASGMYLVVGPEPDRNGKWRHNAHPDRTALNAQAGDVLVHKRRQYRMPAAAVQ
jgi:hypothetical protein